MQLDTISKKKMSKFCRENDIAFLGIFGSVARQEDTSKSDIDLIVRFSQTKGLFEIIRIERELSHVFGRKADLLTEGALHPMLRNHVMKDLSVIYERAR